VGASRLLTFLGLRPQRYFDAQLTQDELSVRSHLDKLSKREETVVV